MTFTQRLIGAALLDPTTYEDVEADNHATGQSVAIVLLASVAGGIGLSGLGASSAQSLLTGVLGALAGWVAWSGLTYLIGTRLLPTPDTRADIGELLRTIAFATSPGLLRVFGAVPVAGGALYGLASVWMLIAMVIAVRQALDYRSTGRALAVCMVGWVLSLAIAVVIGVVFSPAVS